MASHGAHSDPKAVLHEGCPRCEEHAAQPWFTLDAENREELLHRALAFDGQEVGRLPVNGLERQACQRIVDVLNAVRALVDYRTSVQLVDRLIDP